MKACRSGAETTVVLCIAVLSDGFESISLAVMVALLLIVPCRVGLTTMRTEPWTPTRRLPRLQVTVPLVCEQVPRPLVADTKVTFGGRLSVRIAPVAATGPLFPTPIT